MIQTPFYFVMMGQGGCPALADLTEKLVQKITERFSLIDIKPHSFRFNFRAMLKPNSSYDKNSIVFFH